MTTEETLSDFFSNVDWDNVRVKRYPNRVFLCGSSKKRSIRRILYPHPHPSTPFVLAENAMKWADAKAFTSDLLELEEYLAAVVNIVLIVSESPGSFAEMGSFATNKNLIERVLIVIEEKFYKEDSFIRYGIVQRIQGTSIDPTYQICVIPDKSKELWKATSDSRKTTIDTVQKAIGSFKEKKTRKFDVSKLNSKILLLLDIIIIANVIKKSELKKFYRKILSPLKASFSNKEFERMMFVLDKVALVEKHIVGNTVFYHAKTDLISLIYKQKDTPIRTVAFELKKEIKEDLFKRKGKSALNKIRIIETEKTQQIKSSISEYLNTNSELRKQFINDAPLKYKVFYIPKKNGGKREIAQPTTILKEIQKDAMRTIESSFPIHPSAKAYIKGKNGILSNARAHIKSNFFVKFDFEDFFHSIRAVDFNKFMQDNGLSLSDRVLYLKIFFMFNKLGGRNQTRAAYRFFKGKHHDIRTLSFMTNRYKNDFRLSIGAPSSPWISNVILYDFDNRIHAWAKEKKITYTRYADDLTFSSTKQINDSLISQKIVEIISGIPYLNIRLNPSKTKNISLAKRVTVTGLNITPTHSISIGRTQKKKIRAMLHSYGQNEQKFKQFDYLKGWLSYIKSVEPEHFDYLQSKYGNEIRKIFNKQ